MKHEPRYSDRIQMIKAMELIARSINDEDIFEVWLDEGVADGDIEPGDLSADLSEIDLLQYYLTDDNYAELMELFLRLMKHALRSGGLYSDGVVSHRSCD